MLEKNEYYFVDFLFEGAKFQVFYLCYVRGKFITVIDKIDFKKGQIFLNFTKANIKRRPLSSCVELHDIKVICIGSLLSIFNTLSTILTTLNFKLR